MNFQTLGGPLSNVTVPGQVGPNGADATAPVVDIRAASELALSVRDAMRVACVRDGLARAAEKRIINQDYSNAVVRQLRPTFDLNFGANANQDWLTTALVAGVANNIINNRQVPVNQLFVFYGINTFEAAPVAAEVQFQKGNAGSGGLLGIFNLEYLYNKLETEGYFSKAIMYDPQDIIFTTLLPIAAAAGGQRYFLEGYSIEPVGIVYPNRPN